MYLLKIHQFLPKRLDKDGSTAVVEGSFAKVAKIVGKPNKQINKLIKMSLTTDKIYKFVEYLLHVINNIIPRVRSSEVGRSKCYHALLVFSLLNQAQIYLRQFIW